MSEAMDRANEMMAGNAMSRANEAYGKWESHEQLCAERYRRLDETMERFERTLDKAVKIGLGILLAVTGALAMFVFNLLTARMG